MDGVLRNTLSIRIELRQEVMPEFDHNMRHPDPAFSTVEPLPHAQRDPVFFGN